jgi:hypothetical protein
LVFFLTLGAWMATASWVPAAIWWICWKRVASHKGVLWERVNSSLLISSSKLVSGSAMFYKSPAAQVSYFQSCQ